LHILIKNIPKMTRRLPDSHEFNHYLQKEQKLWQLLSKFAGCSPDTQEMGPAAALQYRNGNNIQ